MDKSFRKPDLNGPRFRPKRHTMLNKKLFLRFKEKYPEYSDLTLNEFKSIIKTFNRHLGQGLIDNRDGVELPQGLGYIFMGSCPATKSKKNVDMKKSKDFGVRSTHKNWDSDNMLLKIFYTNRSSRYPFQNRQIWSFKAVKPLRVKASKAYKKNWPKYIVVDPAEKISALYDRARKKEFVKSYLYKVPEGYDEFKM